MKKIFLCVMAFVFCSAVSNVAVRAEYELDADAEFLVRTVAAEYPELELAPRVGIIAVIRNRMASDNFPDTAAGVISTYREGDGELRFRQTGLTDIDLSEPRSYRMSVDAYKLALAGADPTFGALDFDIVGERRAKPDLNFDDSSEEALKNEVERELIDYKIVMDGVAFK